jgi:MFS family permease
VQLCCTCACVEAWLPLLMAVSRRVLVVGLFLWSAATALTGLPCIAASSCSTAAATAAAAAASWVLPLLLLSRGLMGLASAAAMPCVTATSAQLVPPAERASAVAAAYSAFNIGG